MLATLERLMLRGLATILEKDCTRNGTNPTPFTWLDIRSADRLHVSSNRC